MLQGVPKPHTCRDHTSGTVHKRRFTNTIGEQDLPKGQAEGLDVYSVASNCGSCCLDSFQGP